MDRRSVLKTLLAVPALGAVSASLPAADPTERVAYRCLHWRIGDYVLSVGDKVGIVDPSKPRPATIYLRDRRVPSTPTNPRPAIYNCHSCESWGAGMATLNGFLRGLDDDSAEGVTELTDDSEYLSNRSETRVLETDRLATHYDVHGYRVVDLDRRGSPLEYHWDAGFGVGTLNRMVVGVEGDWSEACRQGRRAALSLMADPAAGKADERDPGRQDYLRGRQYDAEGQPWSQVSAVACERCRSSAVSERIARYPYVATYQCRACGDRWHAWRPTEEHAAAQMTLEGRSVS